MKAGFTKNGEMIRIINNLAPGLDHSRVSTNFGNPANAVSAAANNIGYELKSNEFQPNPQESSSLKSKFGVGDWAITAEKMYSRSISELHAPLGES